MLGFCIIVNYIIKMNIMDIQQLGACLFRVFFLRIRGTHRIHQHEKNTPYIRSNYSDLTRPHPKWWFSKGNPLISEKPRLVKYYNLARYMREICLCIFFPTTRSKSKPFVETRISHHHSSLNALVNQHPPPTYPPPKKTTNSRPYDEGLLTIGFPLSK